MEDRVILTKCDCLFDKGKKLLLLLHAFPVRPAHTVVLAPGIVVSVLGIAELISAIDHRCSLAQKQHQERISKLLFTQAADGLLPGRTLYSTVPGIVIITSIVIVLTICLIVTVIVSHCIIQGKTVLALPYS